MSGGTKDVLRHLESVNHKKEMKASEDQQSIFKCGVTRSEKMSNEDKSFSTAGAEKGGSAIPVQS